MNDINEKKKVWTFSKLATYAILIDLSPYLLVLKFNLRNYLLKILNNLRRLNNHRNIEYIVLNQNESGFNVSIDLILFSFCFYIFSKLNRTKKIAKIKKKNSFSWKNCMKSPFRLRPINFISFTWSWWISKLITLYTIF